VTDAIDRKDREIGATDQSGKQRRRVLKTAIVVQEHSAAVFDQGSKLRDLV